MTLAFALPQFSSLGHFYFTVESEPSLNSSLCHFYFTVLSEQSQDSLCDEGTYLIPYLYYTQSQSNIQWTNYKFFINFFIYERFLFLYHADFNNQVMFQTTSSKVWNPPLDDLHNNVEMHIQDFCIVVVRLVDSARLSSLWRTGLILRFGIRRMTDMVLRHIPAWIWMNL